MEEIYSKVDNKLKSTVEGKGCGVFQSSISFSGANGKTNLHQKQWRIQDFP